MLSKRQAAKLREHIAAGTHDTYITSLIYVAPEYRSRRYNPGSSRACFLVIDSMKYCGQFKSRTAAVREFRKLAQPALNNFQWLFGKLHYADSLEDIKDVPDFVLQLGKRGGLVNILFKPGEKPWQLPQPEPQQPQPQPQSPPKSTTSAQD